MAGSTISVVCIAIDANQREQTSDIDPFQARAEQWYWSVQAKEQTGDPLNTKNSAAFSSWEWMVWGQKTFFSGSKYVGDMAGTFLYNT